MDLSLSLEELAKLPWRRSTRSGAAGHCVETAKVPNGMAVRDSKDQAGPVLMFPVSTWNEFIAAAKDGEFDL